MRRSDALLSNLGNLLIHDIALLNLLLDLRHTDMRNSIIAIKDPADLLESRAPGLRVHEVHPDKLDADPALEESALFLRSVLLSHRVLTV